MTKAEICRFIELRDGKALPANPGEVLELARFCFRAESARIEQAMAQQRPPNPQEIRSMESDAVKKILKIASDYLGVEGLQ